MTDHGTIRLVIGLVGLVTLTLVAILGLLAWQQKDLPEALTTLAGGGMGALSAFLVSTRGSSPGGDGGTVSASVDVTAPTTGD